MRLLPCLALATLACTPHPDRVAARPLPPLPPVAPVAAAPAVAPEADPAADLELLGRELTDVYADRRISGATASSTARMRSLRARAERLTGANASVGVVGDYVARTEGDHRIVTGLTGATLLDPELAPIGWFDIDEPTGRCPPCGPNARTLHTFLLDARLAVILPLRYASDALVVDVSRSTAERVAVNLASLAVSPDRRALAFVTFRYDGEPSACVGALTTAASPRGLTVLPAFIASDDFCQSQTDASWTKKNGLVVTSEATSASLRVDTETGRATAAPAPSPHREPPHASTALCGAERRRLRQIACSVASRWVFPPDACEGAEPAEDERAAVVCSPHFQGL